MIKMSLEEKFQLDKFLKEIHITSVLILLYLFLKIHTKFGREMNILFIILHGIKKLDKVFRAR